MECKLREEAVASKSSASSENNSIDRAVTLKKSDFGKICRCCLSHETIANIFYLKFGDTLLVDIFFKLLGTQVNSSDGLPKYICEPCLASLINFYDFQKKYNDSLAALLSALKENQDYKIQHMKEYSVNKNNDSENEDIQEEMLEVNFSENELDEEYPNEDINNSDNTELNIFKGTQKPESTISDDPNKIFTNDEESGKPKNKSFSIPKSEDVTEHKQFKMENSDIYISEKELDEEFQYEINEKENTIGVDNNNESATFLSPKKQKQKFTSPHKYTTNTKGSYVCVTCGKRFLQEASLQVHYRTHKLSLLVNQISAEKGVASPITNNTKEKRKNTCRCGEVFTSSKVLARHKTEKNHLDELDTKCTICNKVVTSRGLYRHMRTAHKSELADVKLDCSTCGKIFKTRRYLLQHLKIHGEKNFLCAYCGKRLHNTASFKTHCLSHTGEKPFPCNVCGQKFGSSRYLRTHMYIHTGKKPYVCKFCHKAFRRSFHLNSHLRTHTGEKSFKCPYCDKSFAHDSTRVIHIRTHTGEKPYICDICGESFSQKNQLVLHQKLHTDEKSYACDHCGETFSTENSYRNHLVVQHQQKINSVDHLDFQCKICNKFYSSKKTLNTHMYQHGEKTVLCTDCGKSFYTKNALYTHSLVHSGVKKFSCDLCDKKFARLRSYREHQYIHSGYKPYTCKICSKDFRRNAELVSHMRIHTGEKPYGCPYCDKTFAHFTTRTDHIRSHTGEKPYVCDVCFKGFRSSSMMSKHRQRHFRNKFTLKNK